MREALGGVKYRQRQNSKSREGREEEQETGKPGLIVFDILCTLMTDKGQSPSAPRTQYTRGKDIHKNKTEATAP